MRREYLIAWMENVYHQDGMAAVIDELQKQSDAKQENAFIFGAVFGAVLVSLDLFLRPSNEPLSIAFGVIIAALLWLTFRFAWRRWKGAQP